MRLPDIDDAATALTKPSTWPLWLRRTLVAAFPVAVPLWWATVAIFFASITLFGLAVVCVCIPAMCARDAWRAAKSLWRPSPREQGEA